MTELLAQHGAAKGSKITDGINNNELFGVIFSQNDERIDSIEKYVNASEFLNYDNTFIDPQFYFSTFEKSVLKKLGDIEEFPSNIARRDWRKRSPKLLDYLDYHAGVSTNFSNMLITPGFFIDNIDWHFDYSIDIYKYCVEKYSESSNHSFENYALSLLISASFFNNTDNVNEMIEELEEECDSKDFIYMTICHDGKADVNYEEMDANCLGNILYFIYRLKRIGFKFIMGYTFMNSILFSMVGCDFVSSGWFNTLRKFQKNRFDLTDTFGKRKKRYTSIPLLSNIMFDDIHSMVESGAITEKEILSNTEFDRIHRIDEDSVSFVDLEHQYWESISKVLGELSGFEDIQNRLNVMNQMIGEALEKYQKVIQVLDKNNEKVAVTRIRTASKHLASWLSAIDKFKNQSMII
jgi:hypothetical protein